MQVAEACDENTIGVVGILGTTYSGHFEDVAGIDAAIGVLGLSLGLKTGPQSQSRVTCSCMTLLPASSCDLVGPQGP